MAKISLTTCSESFRVGVESGWGILRDTEYLKYNPPDQAGNSAVFLSHLLFATVRMQLEFAMIG